MLRGEPGEEEASTAINIAIKIKELVLKKLLPDVRGSAGGSV